MLSAVVLLSASLLGRNGLLWSTLVRSVRYLANGTTEAPRHRDAQRIYPVLLCVLCVSVVQKASAQLIDKTPAAVPVAPSVYNREPYEDPLVSGINRDAARATAYSYATVNDALQNNRERSGRYLSLNGDWDFSFALKPGDEPKEFYKSKVTGWKKNTCAFQLGNAGI